MLRFNTIIPSFPEQFSYTVVKDDLQTSIILVCGLLLDDVDNWQTDSHTR